MHFIKYLYKYSIIYSIPIIYYINFEITRKYFYRYITKTIIFLDRDDYEYT